MSWRVKEACVTYVVLKLNWLYSYHSHENINTSFTPSLISLSDFSLIRIYITDLLKMEIKLVMVAKLFIPLYFLIFKKFYQLLLSL